MQHELSIMGMQGVSFFGMLVIGALAGWIAERAMNRNHGLLTNILVGIAGSFVGGTLASLVGQSYYGFFGNLIVATVGAILILWVFGRREPGQRPPSSGGDAPGGPMYHTRDDRDRQ
jgi:uncharacterized membrane protein YeaQ/YmgE (transglycosylase-associated protein family)